MTKRIALLTAVSLDTPRGRRPGVTNHVERKRRFLQAAGFEVVEKNIGMSSRTAVIRAIPALAFDRSVAATYVRFSTRTLAATIVLAVLRRPLIIEMNGLVDQFVPGRLRPAVRFLLRRLATMDHVVIVGDESWRAYSANLFGPDRRYIELPLTPAVDHIAPAPWTKTVVYAGAFTGYQGLDLLIDTWGAVRHDGWKLVLHGDGPLRNELLARTKDIDSIEIAGMLEGDDYRSRLATAGVLIGHYPGVGLPSYRRSMLKTLDYAVTDRPFVTNDLDTILDHLAPAEHGIYVWDRHDAASLADEIQAAISAAVADGAWPDRWKTLAEHRGDAVQIETLRRAVQAVQ